MAKKRSFEMACGVAEFDLKKRRNSAKSGVVGSSAVFVSKIGMVMMKQ